MKWDAKYENGILTLSSLSIDDGGPIIEIGKDGVVNLYEDRGDWSSSDEKQFYKSYKNICEAIEEAEKWA